MGAGEPRAGGGAGWPESSGRDGAGAVRAPRVSMRAFVVLAVAVAVGLALAVSPYASSEPDGLERVATDHGFVDDGRLHALQEDAPVPDYVFPGVGDGRLATGVAGFVGTLAVFAIAYGIGWALRRRAVGGAPGASPRAG